MGTREIQIRACYYCSQAPCPRPPWFKVKGALERGLQGLNRGYMGTMEKNMETTDECRLYET